MHTSTYIVLGKAVDVSDCRSELGLRPRCTTHLVVRESFVFYFLEMVCGRAPGRLEVNL